MTAITTATLVVLLGATLGPAIGQQLHPSYAELVRRLQEPVSPPRPRLITKYDFLQTRQQKAGPIGVPPPFTVSTGLTVAQNEEQNRRGRAFSYGRPARSGLFGRSLALAVEGAPTIQGVRRPDDETDRVVHRGGRFINNVFIPSGAAPPPEVRVQGGFRQRPLRRAGRSYSQYVEDTSDYGPESNYVEDVRNYRQPSFAFRDFYSGRRQEQEDATALESRQDSVYVPAPAQERKSTEPVYFLSEDPDSLHADRSPYTFEPAAQQAQQSARQPAVMAASNEDFVIKQHTYQMCPSCPTFSIPIPVPKSAVGQLAEVTDPYASDPGYAYQHGEPSTIVSRLTSWAAPLLASARASMAGLMGQKAANALDTTTFSDRLSPSVAQAESNPLLLAGLAAAGLGIATLLSSGLQLLSLGGGVGRAFGEAESETSNALGGALADYDMHDLLCMPRMYCEKLKRRKHVIDQYPNTKKVATWIVGRLFDQDKVLGKEEEEPIFNKCNLRECLMALLD